VREEAFGDPDRRLPFLCFLHTKRSTREHPSVKINMTAPYRLRQRGAADCAGARARIERNQDKARNVLA
jgi:hypothetical protein